jgi:hypothetical protein
MEYRYGYKFKFAYRYKIIGAKNNITLMLIGLPRQSDLFPNKKTNMLSNFKKWVAS